MQPTAPTCSGRSVTDGDTQAVPMFAVRWQPLPSLDSLGPWRGTLPGMARGDAGSWGCDARGRDARRGAAGMWGEAVMRTRLSLIVLAGAGAVVCHAPV